jgi:Tol biopolymer transport system component
MYPLSSNGQYVAYFHRHGEPSPQRKATQLAVVPLDANRPVSFFDIPPSTLLSVEPRWRPGSAVVTYAVDQEGTVELWGQSAAGGSPQRLADVSAPLITSFDWSNDGKELLVTRGIRSFDLVVLELRP